MSTYENELSGVDLDDLKDTRGWLEAATVAVKSGRFGKREQKYKDDKNNGQEVTKQIISVKVMGTTTKNAKEVTIGEYSTGIPWDSADVGVSPDGKALVAKRSLSDAEKKKLIGKNTAWAFFLKMAVKAGVSQSKVSVFRADCVDGVVFQFTNDKPTKDSFRDYTVPFQVQGGAVSSPGSGEATSEVPPTSVALDPAVTESVRQALAAVVAKNGNVKHMDLFSKGYLNDYFGQAGVPADQRSTISNVIWTQKTSLNTLLAGSGVVFENDEFKLG